MDAKVLRAYEYLMPADQRVINALIMSLYKKEKEKIDLARGYFKELEKTDRITAQT